ncbi:hypothetical protein [Evansella clarkii]|nr:hypothetical protein [Evansella clarkii]
MIGDERQIEYRRTGVSELFSEYIVEWLETCGENHEVKADK